MDTEKLIPKLIDMGGVEELRDALTLAKELMNEDAEEVLDGHGNRLAWQENAENLKKALDYMLLIRRGCVPWLKVGDLDAERIYWESLRLCAPHDFDCFCRYIEKDRDPRKRFYEPRRKQLLPIARSLQKLEDNELDMLAISLPPGVGKALANETPVMTYDGWKKHGDLRVGDRVIGMDGRYKKVVAVHPKCMLDREIEFTNGEKIVCHENHEWMVYDRTKQKLYTAETKYLETRSIEAEDKEYNLWLPQTVMLEGETVAFKIIKHITPVEGNCITVEGDGMYLVGKTMLPTHNTTIAIFYICWISGLHPDLQNLIGSHNNEFLRGVYDEILRICEPDGEYCWTDVFPHVSVAKQNAKALRIDLGRRKRFETIELTSIGSGNAGKVRATNLLYCDDLCEGIEQAMSVERMNKLWQTYTVDLRQRKLGDRVKELHIQTRWSVNDVVGHLQELYENDQRAEFINIPALDEDGNSNFDYPWGLGYTKEMLADLEQSFDEASWKALYMGEPIERSGLLYSAEELRRYFELPEREPDAIIAACDTKDRGEDFGVLIIAYQYGTDFYVHDVVCDNAKLDVVEAKFLEALLRNNVQMCRVESNAAGGRVAMKLQDQIHERGGITKITTKYTQKNKETRIIMAQPFFQEHFLIKDDSVIKGDRDYQRFVSQLCSYTMMGRNKHDDAPDAASMIVEYVQTFSAGRIQVFNRPF